MMRAACSRKGQPDGPTAHFFKKENTELILRLKSPAAAAQSNEPGVIAIHVLVRLLSAFSESALYTMDSSIIIIWTLYRG